MTKQEKIIELYKALDKKQWNLIQTDDSRFIVQSALATYYGSDEYSPEYRKLCNKEDRLYFQSMKLHKSISKLKAELEVIQSEPESKDELRDIILTFEKWVLSHEHIIRDYETPEQVADQYLKTH
jgi:hypothetical protein